MLAKARLSPERRLLIVDDDEELSQAISDILSFEGFATTCLRNGWEALGWLRSHPGVECVVLLDLMMPVMDGKAFLKVKESDPSLANIPVVVFTAGGDCRALSASRGFPRCLPKTAPIADLVAAIDAAANERPLPLARPSSRALP